MVVYLLNILLYTLLSQAVSVINFSLSLSLSLSLLFRWNALTQKTMTRPDCLIRRWMQRLLGLLIFGATIIDVDLLVFLEHFPPVGGQ